MMKRKRYIDLALSFPKNSELPPLLSQERDKISRARQQITKGLGFRSYGVQESSLQYMVDSSRMDSRLRNNSRQSSNKIQDVSGFRPQETKDEKFHSSKKKYYPSINNNQCRAKNEWSTLSITKSTNDIKIYVPLRRDASNALSTLQSRNDLSGLGIRYHGRIDRDQRQADFDKIRLIQNYQKNESEILDGVSDRECQLTGRELLLNIDRESIPVTDRIENWLLTCPSRPTSPST